MRMSDAPDHVADGTGGSPSAGGRPSPSLRPASQRGRCCSWWRSVPMIFPSRETELRSPAG